MKPAVAKPGKPGQSPSLVKQDSAYLEARARVPSEEDKYDNPISTKEAVQGSCDGEAAALQKYGPPKPGCNEARMANVEELGLRNKASKDPQIREFFLHLPLVIPAVHFDVPAIAAAISAYIRETFSTSFLRVWPIDPDKICK